MSCSSRGNLVLSSHNIQGSVAALWAAHTGIQKISQDVKNGKHDVEDDLNSMLIEIADRISIIILPVCDGAALDDGTATYSPLIS